MDREGLDLSQNIWFPPWADHLHLLWRWMSNLTKYGYKNTYEFYTTVCLPSSWANAFKSVLRSNSYWCSYMFPKSSACCTHCVWIMTVKCFYACISYNFSNLLDIFRNETDSTLTGRNSRILEHRSIKHLFWWALRITVYNKWWAWRPLKCLPSVAQQTGPSYYPFIQKVIYKMHPMHQS